MLWTATRYDPTDFIASVVGGNRYGFFVYINIPAGIAAVTIIVMGADTNFCRRATNDRNSRCYFETAVFPDRTFN